MPGPSDKKHLIDLQAILSEVNAIEVFSTKEPITSEDNLGPSSISHQKALS
jgi:hypothetical protein